VGIAGQVFSSLKREIIEARLEPETILVEGALAQRYGVSKGPTREALKRLEQIGLVRAVPRVGYIVSTVNLGDLDEIFTLRFALEPIAAGLAAQRASDAELDALETLAREPLELAQQPAAERAAALARSNTAFHRTIGRLSGNRRLEAAVGSLADDVERVVHMLGHEPMLDHELMGEHSELAQVMRGRVASVAEETMRRQLSNDYANLTRVALASRQAGPRRLAPVTA
jgi:DNA-binding GntR family transcriptional regulator